MSMMRVRHTPPTWHTSALRTSLIMEEHAFLVWRASWPARLHAFLDRSLSHWRSRGEQRSRRGRHPPSTIVSNVETLHVSLDHSQCPPGEFEQKADFVFLTSRGWEINEVIGGGHLHGQWKLASRPS